MQRACQAIGLGRATYYRPIINWVQRDAPIIEALTALGETQPRWGFWKYVDRLRNTGHRWNHKRLWRVYCHLRLNLAPPDEETVPRSAPAAPGGDPGTERGLSDGFHE